MDTVLELYIICEGGGRRNESNPHRETYMSDLGQQGVGVESN